MSDNECCPGGHICPRRSCACNSRSEQPCSWCDWWDQHGDCKPKETEEEDDYEEEPGDFYERQTSWDNND